MGVVDDLRAGMSGARPGLIVRHAAREPIRSAADVLEAPITSEGLAAAREFGASLADIDEVVFWYSPIRRTRQTAQAMLEGLCLAGGAGHLADMLPALGGPYLTDPEAAMRAFVRDRQAFMRGWFDGDLPRSMVLPLRESADLQLRGLDAALRAQEPGGLAVFVTHDLNLLVLREALFGIRHEEAGWIDCLDGLWLELTESALRVGFGADVVDVAAVD